MIIIARPFPDKSHSCVDYLSYPKEPYFELIQNTFHKTCISDTVTEGETVKISKTKCDKCDREYGIIEGRKIHCIIDRNNKILRGYQSD